MNGEILIASNYERCGSVYAYDAGDNAWYGHYTSKSYWVRFCKAPIILQYQLTRAAIAKGYDPDIFSKPKPQPKSKATKSGGRTSKASVKKTTSDSFIPLF